MARQWRRRRLAAMVDELIGHVGVLEQRVAALEAGRPMIVSIRAANARPGRFASRGGGKTVSMTSYRPEHAEVERV
jgi:hypothetical protein